MESLPPFHSPSGTVERELKFVVPAGFQLPELGDLAPGISVSAERVERQAAVYFDTRDLRLSRWGYGLRCRSTDGWSLKLPAEGRGEALSRRELHFPGLEEPVGAPPAAALDLLLAVTRHAELGPIARLRTIRRSVSLRDAEDRLLVEVTNDQVALMEGERVVRRFREAEVEFSEGCPPALLERIAERIRRAGGSDSHRVPKHLRALGLEGLGEEVPVPEPRPELSAAALIQQVLARSVSELVRHDAGVRIDEDIEDLHRMRVATRRLRSHLRTFRPLLEPEAADALRAELRWLGGELGRVRDADILGQHLAELALQLPEPERRSTKEIFERLQESRREDLERLLVSLRSSRYVDLVDSLVEMARAPQLRSDAWLAGGRSLRKPVRARWKRLARALARLGKHPADSELHRVRILAKHARYAAEAVEPVFGADAAAFAVELKRLQGVLGDHHDAVVTLAWLRAVAPELPREAAFSAGRLAERVERLGIGASRDWRGRCRAVSQRRNWRWLGKSARPGR